MEAPKEGETREESMEEIIVDLSNIPLKPIGKREISQLEMALIIGTLYRPEIIELIRDPVERSTWVDSLAVAAKAYARMKAGLTVGQIAEELGRSEAAIRGHLTMKTKAGKLVHETYEKLRKGELKLVAPFIKAPAAGYEDQVKALEEMLEKHKERIKELESALSECSKYKDAVQALEAKVKELQDQVKRRSEEIQGVRSRLEDKLKALEDSVKALRDAVSELSGSIQGILEELEKSLG